MSDFKPGDVVITVKGCQFEGPPGEMTVVRIGGKWRQYDQVQCRKPDGYLSMFLAKNLRLVKRGEA